MSDKAQVYLSIALFVAGIACISARDIARSLSKKPWARGFWLHLGAPIVGIVLITAGLVVAALVIHRGQERLRQQRLSTGDEPHHWTTAPVRVAK